MTVSAGALNKSAKKKLKSIKEQRQEEFAKKGPIERYTGRLAYNHFTNDERYDLVKLAGPKIKEAVEFVRTTEGLSRAEKQEFLDNLVTRAKIQAKREYLNLRGTKKSNFRLYNEFKKKLRNR